MKNIILIIYLVFFYILVNVSDSFAQLIYHDFLTPLNEQPGTMFYQDSFIYYTFIISPENAPDSLQTYILYKATTQGVVVDSLIIENQPGTGPNLGSYMAYDNKIYLILGYRGNSVTNSHFNIKRINLDLEIEVDKEYEVDFNSYYGFFFKFINNRMYLFFFGGHWPDPGTSDYSQIFRFDKNCDTLYTIIKDPFLINGLFSKPNFPDEYYPFFTSGIMKTDTLFNPLWSQSKLGEVDFEPQTKINWISDSNFILLTISYPPGEIGPQIGIIPLDTNFVYNPGNVVFYTTPNHESRPAFINPSFMLSNGDIIIGSMHTEQFDGYFNQYPISLDIRRYNSGLDLLWVKSISDSDSSFYMHQVLDVGDGFIVSGAKYKMNDVNQNYDVVLYKFDYDGNFSQIFQRPGVKPDAQVYPNPGSDFLQLQCFQDVKDAHFVMHDMAGRQMLKQKITSARQEFITAIILPGTYIWSVQHEGKVLYSGKWVKK